MRAIEVDPETVGQYTGLKDKNGKEIWEGDIISAFKHPRVQLSVVEYENGCFTWKGEPLCYDIRDYDCHTPTEDWAEVIGTIHDNPELLTPKEGDNK